MKRESLRIIVRYFVTLFPYKIQINQPLKLESLQKWKSFYQNLLFAFEIQDLNIDKVWFIDEAHFRSSSYVNKLKCRY